PPESVSPLASSDKSTPFSFMAPALPPCAVHRIGSVSGLRLKVQRGPVSRIWLASDRSIGDRSSVEISVLLSASPTVPTLAGGSSYILSTTLPAETSAVR